MFTCMICYSRGEAGRRIWGAKSSWAWATVAVPVINIVVDLLSSCLHWSEEWFLGFTCQDENNTSFLYTFSSWKTIQHWKINWNVHFLKVQAHSAFCSHCLKDANTKFWRQSSHCSRNGKKISVRYLECRINVSDLLCFDPPPPSQVCWSWLEAQSLWMHGLRVLTSPSSRGFRCAGLSHARATGPVSTRSHNTALNGGN